MSVKISSSIWEYSRCKGSELLLMLAIADNADDDGQAYPSIKYLAKKIRMTERCVQLLIRKLDKRGELSIAPGEGPHGSNLYRVKSFQGEGGEKFSGGVKQLVHRGGETASSPKPSLNRHKESQKHLAPDDWLCQWLKTQDILDIPFAFLDDEKWWAAASILITDGLNTAWLERQFAEMTLHFQERDSTQPRTEAGWKRFLKHWFKVADKIEQREKRQEKYYGKTHQS